MTDAPQPAAGSAAAPEAPPPPEESLTVTGIAQRIINFESFSVFIATIALGLVIYILHPGFGSADQLKDMLQQSVYIGVLAAGMAFLISMREIDLSVGSIFGLTLIISALLMKHGMNPWLAGLIGVLLGGACGLLNAILVQVITIPAIVATLATLSMFRGLALALSNGEQVTGLPVTHPFFTKLGGDLWFLPFSVWVMLVVAIVLTAVLRLTPFGYRVRSIGSNPEAATFSGISIPRVRVQALVLMGALAGLAGMLGLAFFEIRRPEHRHRLRARGDRGDDHRRHAAARRLGDGGRRGHRRDPALGGQQRPRLLQRAGQLERVRDRRGDPARGGPRQPAAPPAPWAELGVGTVSVVSSSRRGSCP